MRIETEDPDPGQRGLRSSVGLACRRFRRGEPGSEAHGRDCGACRSHAVTCESLAVLLRQRPAAPIELSSPELLPAIFERVVTSSEAGVAGALLRKMPVEPAANSYDAAAELLESSLAMAMFTRPRGPSAATWESVRGAILSSRHEVPVAIGAHRRRRWLGVATVAAAAMVCGVLFSDGTRVDPTIVFSDVTSLPAVEYAVLRHGIPR